jgi:hypothetical protein
MTRPLLHILLHVLVPGIIAWVVYRQRWTHAWVIMVLTMLVDLDHVLATPIYDPHRCSIGFHPLHTWWAITVYCGLLAWPRTRLLGAGLVIHMVLDASDCVWMALT